LSDALASGFAGSGTIDGVGVIDWAGIFGLVANDSFGGLLPGIYKGPRCPQAASVQASTSIAARRGKIKSGFTIRIMVYDE